MRLFLKTCLLPFAFFPDIIYLCPLLFFFSNLKELFFNTKMIPSVIIVTGLFSQIATGLLLWMYGNFTSSNLLFLFFVMYSFIWLALASLKIISLGHDDES